MAAARSIATVQVVSGVADTVDLEGVWVGPTTTSSRELMGTACLVNRPSVSATAVAQRSQRQWPWATRAPMTMGMTAAYEVPMDRIRTGA